MTIIHGRNIKILDTAANVVISAAKSCTLTKKSDVIERASATSATAREYIAGRTQWEVSLSHLVTCEAPFEGILKVGMTYTLRVDISGTAMQGTAICTEAGITGTRGSLGTGSVKFRGTGELSAYQASS